MRQNIKWIYLLSIFAVFLIPLVINHIFSLRAPITTVKLLYLAHYFVPEANIFKSLLDRWNKLYFLKERFQVQVVDVDREDFLIKMIVSGSCDADLVFLTNFNIGLFADKLEPLDSILQERYLQDLYPSALNSVKINGSIYGLPLHIVTPLLIYNEKYITKTPENWNEFKIIAKNFTRKLNVFSPTPYGAAIYCLPGVHGGVILHSIVNSLGGNISLQNITETLESLRIALQLYSDLSHEGVLPENISSYEWMVMMERFKINEFPMMIGWSYSLREMDIDSVKIAPIPSEAGQHNIRIYVVALGILKSSPNKRGAIKFVETLLNKPLLKEAMDLGYLPPIKTLLVNSRFPSKDQLSTILERFTAPALNVKRAKEMYESLSVIVKWVIDRRITLEEALRIIEFKLRMAARKE